MTRAFEFHPEAQAELIAATDWYDDREVGVGDRFVAAVRSSIDSAVADPEAWAMWPGWEREPVVRSKGVDGFPYRVVYFSGHGRLTILALAHVKRRPGYWRQRIEA